MSDAAVPLARAAAARPTRTAIVRPGGNCWRVERADRFSCIQDGADYFRLVREALLRAERSVFILGWDITAGIDLLPGAPPADGPTRLDELLAQIARRRPRLRCYILIWDYGSLYTLERDPFSRWRLGWRMPRNVTFGFDDRHPVGGAHHQKIVVVDDQLAFCGGVDLTGHRWDTLAHRVDEPHRKTAFGAAYGPYHEIQAMATGPVAASLGALARDRWHALGAKRLPAVAASGADLWPSGVAPDLTGVDVGIARTMPASEAHPAIRECEALFHDSIARAQRTIYIESQYFSSETLAGALAAGLSEPRGPEVVVITPRECHGWLEKTTMGSFRERVFHQLISADASGRLRLVYPLASRAQNVPTFVHSKVMIVDDVLVRIGSANFSRRSLGMDTECDVAADAGGDADARAGIRRIRDRLLAEHLALPAEEVARGIERAGSIGRFIDTRRDAEHTLVPVEIAQEPEPPSELLRAAADPYEPIAFASAVERLVPAVDATAERSPARIWILPAFAVAAAIGVAWASLPSMRPEVQGLRETLQAVPAAPSATWIGAALFVLAAVLLVPLELLAIVAGVLLGALRGGLVGLAGSLVAAAVGYAIGRSLGARGVARWMSLRSYRSARQLGTKGVVGIAVLRLAGVASAASVHLLCGAGRVPFATYMAGTVIGLAPAIAALAGLGALLRHALLHPSIASGLATIGAAVLLIGVAAGLRTLLVIRQFAPSVSGHRGRAEFG